MKQKLLSIICLLITAVLLVSVQGCVNAPAASPGISNQPTAQTTEEAEPSPTEEIFKPFELYKPYNNYTGMYILEGLLDENYTYLDSCLNNGRLLVLRANLQNYKLSAMLMDVEKNQILAQYDLNEEASQDNSCRIGYTGENGFYIMTASPYNLYIYDSELKQISKTDYSEHAEYNIYIDPSGSCYWYCDQLNGRIASVPLDGSEPEYYPMGATWEEDAYVFVSSAFEHYLLLTSYASSQSVYLYDLENQTYTQSGVLPADMAIWGDILAYQQDGTLTYTRLASPGMLYSFPLQCGNSAITNQYEINLAMNGKWFATAQYQDNDTVLRLYDMLSGLPAARSVFDISQYSVNINNLHFAEDYAVISLFEGETARIVLWDCFSDTEETPDVSSAVSVLGQLDCERLNRQLKTQLEEKGINVYYGEEGAGDFPDYTAEIITDQELIYRGLTQVMSTIQKFPDGFFDDLLSEEVRGIDIYLCGTFTPINPQWGIDTASAFAVVYNSRQIIAMNLDYIYSFEQTLAHEFMHAIERRIQQMVWDNQIENGFFLWDAFLPENYYYTNSYRAPDGSEYDSFNRPKYTPYDSDSYSDISNVYFVDGYSTTFASEDMARIFENLFAAQSELPYFFESPNLMIKAQYLCSVIRECLPSVSSSEEVIWERFVELKPVEWFEERYHLEAAG